MRTIATDLPLWNKQGAIHLLFNIMGNKLSDAVLLVVVVVVEAAFPDSLKEFEDSLVCSKHHHAGIEGKALSSNEPRPNFEGAGQPTNLQSTTCRRSRALDGFRGFHG